MTVPAEPDHVPSGSAQRRDDVAGSAPRGLSLAPLRGLRYSVASERLGQLLCPPYDVISAAGRAELLDRDADNAVAVVLPVPPGAEPDAGDYTAAATQLSRWVDEGVLAVDAEPALYVYEMRRPAAGEDPGSITRGLLGAVELRDPDDGVILPHENTMAGPVADRLALMAATDANLEPIYLVYDGGGPASQVVAGVEAEPVLATAHTPDGIVHRLWAITDPATHAVVAADLGSRSALIADGHHRYATYRQLQDLRRADVGPGPWDRGLALLVDTSAYGPEVHPIHRVVVGHRLDDLIARSAGQLPISAVLSVDAALAELESRPDFAIALTDGERAVVLGSPAPDRITALRRADEPEALLNLDVSVLHRAVIADIWGLADDESTIGYAHDVAEAIALAAERNGTAVLVRATPVAAVAAVAAAGARMPRKSTLFTPKPASGMVIRRFSDQGADTGPVSGAH